ncbi:hypothetical protein GGR52DRAFT_556188 [Hypoxylon sp. FL1284]|nr:hypothetical protein GGR52DRAFT_556188 [Hypoxylon sp. FL1284]
MTSDTKGKSAAVADNEPAQPSRPQTLQEFQESQQSRSQPRWNTARFALRIISLVIAVALLGLSLAGFSAPLGFSSYPVVGTPLSLGAILLDVAGLIVTCVRRRRSGIRPAVSLGFELVLSLGGLGLAALLVCFTISSWGWRRYYDDGPGAPIAHYVAHGHFWFGMSVAATALALILSLIHFVFFVRDCVEVDRQRKAASMFHKNITSTNADPEKTGASDVPARPESVAEQPGPVYPATKRDSMS